MTDYIDDYFSNSDPADLRNVVIELRNNVSVLEQSVLRVNRLGEITRDLGVQKQGGFWFGGGDPHLIDANTSGVGASLPGIEVSGVEYALYAIEAGVLQFGAAMDGSGIYAVGGAIGGWSINSSAIQKLSSNIGIVLDSSTSSIKVGNMAGTFLALDGANQRLRSSNYVANQSGFNISASTGDAEFNNITARGELRSMLFSTGSQIVFQSKVKITKDGGQVSAAVGASDTTIDFGKSMTLNDWVVFEGDDASGTLSLEWVLVGSNVSGTVYNVTRNVDGSGANAWAKDMPFSVVGKSGDFRIEQSAGANPEIVLIRQGATWNTTTTPVVINKDGLQLIGDDATNDASMIQFFNSSLVEYLRMGISGASDTPTIIPQNGKSLILGANGNAGAGAFGGLQINAAGLVRLVNAPFKVTGPVLSNAFAKYVLTDGTDEAYLAMQTAASKSRTVILREPAANVDTPVNHYDVLGPMLSASYPLGVWKDTGYIGAGATAVVPDYTGQGRDLTIQGTVSSDQLSTGNFGQVPYLSVTGGGANFLYRNDEAAFDNARGYFTAMGWFYFGDVNSALPQWVMGQGTTSFGTATQWGVYNWNGYSSGAHKLQLICPNGSTNKIAEHPTLLANNTWYHVVARFTSSTEIALFINNVKTVTTSGISALMNNVSVATRFFRDGTGGGQIRGTNRVALMGQYTAALSDKTIAAIFNSQRDYFGV